MNRKIIKINIFLISAFIIFLIGGNSLNIGNSEKYNVDESNIQPKTAISNDWYNFTLPGPIPSTNINFTRNGSTVSFTLEQIIDYAKYENGTFQLINYTIEKDGSYYEIVGFNPIYLMEIAGWYDVMNFTVNAYEYSKQVNVTQLLLADSNFIKYPDTENETMIIIAWNNQWVADYNVEYGDFYLWGENLAGNQKVKNISSISYDDPWTIEFTLNGTTEALINSINGTTSSIGNHTTYEWGYFDDNAGYGWDERECTGFTIKSLLQHTSIGDQNYEINFISYDGYGENKAFSKSQIEDGYTGYMINDPEEELSNQGKQPMLMDETDGEPLGYYRGPYQLVVPGADKGNYIGGVIEVRITILSDDPTITSPDDVIYVYGETGQTINWTVTDTTVNSQTYSISVNGTEEATGTWTSGTAITFDITGWEVGEYEVIITANDGLGGSVSDTVIVSVTKKSGIPGYTTGFLLIVLFGTTAILIKKRK